MAHLELFAAVCLILEGWIGRTVPSPAEGSCVICVQSKVKMRREAAAKEKEAAAKKAEQDRLAASQSQH